MAKKNYHCEFNEKTDARAVASNQPASLKYSTQIIREIKGKTMKRAEAFLQNVTERKEFIPLVKYTSGAGHKKGDAKNGAKAGRYSDRTCEVFLNLLNSVKANADYKGLDKEKLLIKNVFASTGYQKISYQKQGRIAGKRRKRKSVHLEIVVTEAK
ncbi:MAG: 50S ribosomal protein L22 [Candidatus Diapherotrites archaeon]|nr:50S ribosomal protein L22 [Candidatus Diapherotrites archaeon]